MGVTGLRRRGAAKLSQFTKNLSVEPPDEFEWLRKLDLEALKEWTEALRASPGPMLDFAMARLAEMLVAAEKPAPLAAAAVVAARAACPAIPAPAPAGAGLGPSQGPGRAEPDDGARVVLVLAARGAVAAAAAEQARRRDPHPLRGLDGKARAARLARRDRAHQDGIRILPREMVDALNESGHPYRRTAIAMAAILQREWNKGTPETILSNAILAERAGVCYRAIQFARALLDRLGFVAVERRWEYRGRRTGRHLRFNLPNIYRPGLRWRTWQEHAAAWRRQGAISKSLTSGRELESLNRPRRGGPVFGPGAAVQASTSPVHPPP